MRAAAAFIVVNRHRHLGKSRLTSADFCDWPGRGIGMGVTFQLSTAACCQDYINTRGFAFGSGANSTLLGFNVIGTAVAWGLAALTLLENAEGSNLVITAVHGNTMIKLIQKLLKPVDRLLGGKFDKDEGPELHSVVDERSVDKNAAYTDAVEQPEEPQVGSLATTESRDDRIV